MDFSTTCGVLQRIGGYKIVRSTCAWWVFPQPMEFASEDHVQNSVFHKWLVPQPVDFLPKNLKITWTDKDLKGKENIKRRDRGETDRGERKSSQ